LVNDWLRDEQSGRWLLGLDNVDDLICWVLTEAPTALPIGQKSLTFRTVSKDPSS